MANTGKQSPLGVNALGSVLDNKGLTINPVAQQHMGVSKTNSSYTFGSVVNDTCLRLLTWAIHDGYNRGWKLSTTLLETTYNNLISIGAGTIPALGNSKPKTYEPVDPANVWTTTAQAYGYQTTTNPVLPGPATSGYGNYDETTGIGDPLQGYGVVDQQQNATWYPYDTTNPNHSITQWGWVRCHALQAWNEFNWNADLVTRENPEYKEFCASFVTAFYASMASNQSINTVENSNTFLDGTYSNMDDLISADIAGVSLSSADFGTDLENLGNAFDLKQIETFGLPSNLLKTLGKNLAVTADLTVALLAAGLTTNEISDISSGVAGTIPKEKEQQIYGAYLIITGENLAHILAPLQCKTLGLTTLADLLNVKKIFPTSYPSLTVPVYNATPGPTNSKTYYLLYQNGGVNSSLDAPAIKEYVGTIIPRGQPPISNSALNPENFVTLPKGFASYLQDIIPYDQALAAGALSYSLRQVRHIERQETKRFSKVAKGMENTNGLNLVGGTSKPTNQGRLDYAKFVQATGSGLAGGITMSDFFGCMSGLPYPWKLIRKRILQTQTSNLTEIYKKLFLAVTWEQATATVQYTTYQVNEGTPESPIMVTYYHVTGISVADSGGGYGRGNAPDPIVTLSNGGSGVGIVGRADANAASMGGGTYGRITTITLNNPGPDTTTPPTALVQAPPTSLAGGSNTPPNTAGWSQPMNSVVQSFIDEANAEIAAIAGTNSSAVKHLNQYWDILGTQLKREQRTRYTAIPPVQVPKNFFLNLYPSSLNTFLDTVPMIAQDTRPHMAAQTLEAITDFSSVGGQSLVGSMRQARNQERLQRLGIELDNNIPDQLDQQLETTLLVNGTAPGAVEGISNPDGIQYTIPAWPANIDSNGEELLPTPVGQYFAPQIDQYLALTNGLPVSPAPPWAAAPASPVSPAIRDLPTGFQQYSGVKEGDITPIINGQTNPVVNPLVPAGPIVTSTSIVDAIPIIAPPAEYDPTNLPPNLNPNYTSSTLFPAAPDIKQAIDQVVACNCDCWVK